MEKKPISFPLPFASDYMTGAHPDVFAALTATNDLPSDGYGTDTWSESAREKIRASCGAPGAEVRFVTGGTQVNAVAIGALLRPYEGVIAADTGHVALHEAGAIEAGGHKVLTLPQENGKLTAERIREYLSRFYADEAWEHMVLPGMVYLSQPTEYGTLYSKAELTSIRGVCLEYGLKLYADGARLAYALASPENDLTLSDLASLCDAFSIGGTKCGALFGEALVVPDPSVAPHLFTFIKRSGALLAKGRLLGVQFDALFADGLYARIGKPAIEAADLLRKGFREKGIPLAIDSPTNQLFPVVKNERLAPLAEKVSYTYWEPFDEARTVIRVATNWSTTADEAAKLLEQI